LSEGAIGDGLSIDSVDRREEGAGIATWSRLAGTPEETGVEHRWPCENGQRLDGGERGGKL